MNCLLNKAQLNSAFCIDVFKKSPQKNRPLEDTLSKAIKH